MGDEFDVNVWWENLDEEERVLALRHRNDDPVPHEVGTRLWRRGVLWGEPKGRDSGPVERWHWTPEVYAFLRAKAGDDEGETSAPAT
jgi:hypothetical protein